MSFWDSSALVPLILPEKTSNAIRTSWSADAGPLVWWGTVVECQSAIARRVREGLNADQQSVADDALRALFAFWREVPPGDNVRESATRLIHSYALRAADALQLAAALVGADGSPETVEFVCLDDNLRSAARAEGFVLVP